MNRITMCLEGDTSGKVLAQFDLDEFAEKIRAEERKSVIEEFRNYLKTVTPCEMPQEYWDMGVDNTCDRMLKENK